MEDKDAPLRDDIRFLGRMLGDTLREQEGNDAFTTVEHIRQLATRFHRHDDFAARDQLEALLTALPNEQTTQVARAFSYFSHLANIAEDQHHLRRGRAHAIAGAAPRDGSLINAIVVAQEAGVSATALANFLPKPKSPRYSPRTRQKYSAKAFLIANGKLHACSMTETAIRSRLMK